MSVGIFLASRVGGGIFASLIGTRIYRRWSGRLPLVAFDLLRAGVLGLLLIVPPSQQALILPVIAFGLGFGNSMFAIGLNSQLPRLIEPDQLLKTNAWITSASSAAMVGGSLVSGLLVAGFGFETVFALNALTYLLAAMLILPLRFKASEAKVGSDTESGEWSALVQGLRSAPVVAAMLAVSMADTLGSARTQRRFPDYLETADTGLGEYHTRPDAGGVGQRQTARCADRQSHEWFGKHQSGAAVFFRRTADVLRLHSDVSAAQPLRFAVVLITGGLGRRFFRSRSDVAFAARTRALAPADLQLPDSVANDWIRHWHADRRAVLRVVDAGSRGVAVPRHSAGDPVDGESIGDQARAGCAQQPDASSLRIGQSGRWSP
jgi:hypothetical protein